jgi:methylated-DNA-protein-cysteine methyltransferase-like protein
MAENFRDLVFAAVAKVPSGKVTTYGYIAQIIDHPRAARQVGWMLSTLPSGTAVPWWRIVNGQGYLSIRNDDMKAKVKQAELLTAEGIQVDERFCLDLQQYLWTDGVHTFGAKTQTKRSANPLVADPIFV